MSTDFELMAELLRIADAKHDGHLSILKFTTNWRVSFITPNDDEEIKAMAVGKTFAEAARLALDQYR
jgi:hypothetical protein